MTQLLETPIEATGEAQQCAEVSRSPEVCPLCRAPAKQVFEKYGVWIRECQACSHRYAAPEQPQEEHVATLYDDDYFFGGGAGYDDYLSECDLLVAHGRRYAKVLSRFTEPGLILDVGAAAGFVLKGFVDAGWPGQGVEPNATMARHAREQLQIDVVCGSLESMATDTLFDVVSMVQVVAHFPDPHTAARQVSELVRPGGLCLVETWNVRSWSARLFGENWHEYSPPSVLQWFSPQTLADLFSAHGFEPVAQGRPSKKISIGHARSLLEHGQDESLLARIGAGVLKFVPGSLTLPYPSEDLFWAVFRKA